MSTVGRGKFITLEGVDGAGKSSHVEWVADCLRARDHVVAVTREPGGTPLGEALRTLVLGKSMHIDTETLLMFAARREHIEQVIQPALNSGAWVLSDRFTDATYAYQGGGRGMDWGRIAQLEAWVQGSLQPDLTLIFDLSIEIASARRLGRQSAASAGNPEADRFESENREFFERVRSAYLRRAAENPSRIRLVDAGRSLQNIRVELEEIILSI